MFCYQAALHGKLNFSHASDAYALCGYPSDAAATFKAGCARGGATCELSRLNLARARRPGLWLALDSEDKASYHTNSDEVLKVQRGYGAMPLIALTAADDMLGSPFSQAENRAIERATITGHLRLAHLSSVGVHSVVEHSGHFIQDDQPAVVTAAVAKVVSQARR